MILWHLIRADVRRHRHVLALWMVLSVGVLVLATARPHLLLSTGASAALALAGGLLQLALFLLSVILAPIVMQTHSLSGTTAFWMTRPIAPGRLLAAKLILLGAAFIVFPACALLVAMLASGVPGLPMLFGVVTLVLSQAVWLAAAVAYAALTRTLARYLIAVGSTLIAMVAPLFLVSGLEVLRTDGIPGVQRWRPPSPTDDLVGPVLLAVAFVLVAVVQAFTRNRAASIAAGTAGIGVALAMWSHVPWHMLDPERRPPQWAVDERAGRLVAGPADVQSERNVLAARPATLWRSIRARARLHDLPRAWTAQAQLVTAELRLADGRLLSSPTLNAGAPPSAPDSGNPTHEAIETALGVELVAPPFPPRGESLPVFVMPDTEFRRLAPTVARYVGHFDVLPTAYQLEAHLPLRAGAAFAHDDYRLTLLEVRPGSASIELTVAEASYDTPFGPLMMPAQRRFYLMNASCRCALEIGDRHSSDVAFSVMGVHLSSGSGVQFLPRQRRLAYPTPHAPVPEAFEIDDEWIAGAELVILRTDTHPPFRRLLAIDDFPIRQPPRGDPPGADPDEGAR